MISNVMNIVFLVSIMVSSVSHAKVFLSIDCGSSDTSTDGNMIKWSPDDTYVKTGESRVVTSAYATIVNYVNTLRVFKSGTKNCYSIKISEGGEKVLVRAGFYYGNYDSKHMPPTFDIYLNGKFWQKLRLRDGVALAGFDIREAIIVANGGDISVCLVQTIEGQFPLISTLEIRSLDAEMYSSSTSNQALYLEGRILGSNSLTTIISYPDDIYDRIWMPTSLTPTISGGALLTIDVNVKDNPPVAALQEAVTSFSTSIPISIPLGIQRFKAEVPVLINMYFVELVELDSTEKRSFHAYIDNTRITSTPITPQYGIASELTFTNISVSPTTTLSLKATSDSTKSPILNAFEMYTYSGNSNDNNDSGSGTGNGGSGNDSNQSDPDYSYKRSTGKNKKNKTVLFGTTGSIVVFVWAVVGCVVIMQYKNKSAIVIAVAAGNGGDTMQTDSLSNSGHHILKMSNNTSEG